MNIPAKYSPLEAAAFKNGYHDASIGRSDYVRRSYPHEGGQRAAYMAGRVAWRPKHKDTHGA